MKLMGLLFFLTSSAFHKQMVGTWTAIALSDSHQLRSTSSLSKFVSNVTRPVLHVRNDRKIAHTFSRLAMFTPCRICLHGIRETNLPEDLLWDLLSILSIEKFLIPLVVYSSQQLSECLLVSGFVIHSGLPAVDLIAWSLSWLCVRFCGWSYS